MSRTLAMLKATRTRVDLELLLYVQCVASTLLLVITKISNQLCKVYAINSTGTKPGTVQYCIIRMHASKHCKRVNLHTDCQQPLSYSFVYMLVKDYF